MERREFIATAATAVGIASSVSTFAQTSVQAADMYPPKY
jgi:Cys-rich four helix bundle protein (predicted Tat secretion target)